MPDRFVSVPFFVAAQLAILHSVVLGADVTISSGELVIYSTNQIADDSTIYFPPGSTGSVRFTVSDIIGGLDGTVGAISMDPGVILTVGANGT